MHGPMAGTEPSHRQRCPQQVIVPLHRIMSCQSSRLARPVNGARLIDAAYGVSIVVSVSGSQTLSPQLLAAVRQRRKSALESSFRLNRFRVVLESVYGIPIASRVFADLVRCSIDIHYPMAYDKSARRTKGLKLDLTTPFQTDRGHDRAPAIVGAACCKPCKAPKWNTLVMSKWGQYSGPRNRYSVERRPAIANTLIVPRSGVRYRAARSSPGGWWCARLSGHVRDAHGSRCSHPQRTRSCKLRHTTIPLGGTSRSISQRLIVAR